MQSLTSQKYNYLRAEQLDMRQKGIRMMDDKEMPVMPEMRELLTLPPPYEDSAQRMELSKPDADLKTPPLMTSVPPHASMIKQEQTPETLASPPANNGSDKFEPPFIGDGDAGTPPQ